MHAQTAGHMRQRGADHCRPKIGPTNADIDDIGHIGLAH